jgi:hypothetical protein
MMACTPGDARSASLNDRIRNAAILESTFRPVVAGDGLGVAVALGLQESSGTPMPISVLRAASARCCEGARLAALSGWTPATLPADWTRFRDRWEFGHAVHAALFALGFGAWPCPRTTCRDQA